ncbi:MAG: Rpn family recombination-promoting nuclease/putative transposase [Bacteroidales bacterium]|nr:Rpn family recombination-promoting nuclease/putative transposase [Bacteroidales bacterium]MCF8458098.1 Rpn family recombination-promoting nuclease/putative transposase [Bacteroidales bacterium]
MTDFKAKYINPFTDYGFKRLFGEEPNKDLLLDFLNELLKDQEGEIKEISYLPNERLPITKGDRKAIFDLYCTNEKGEKFIVELQKTKQKYFKDRTLYYSTFPIQEQAIVGNDWDFELKNVYTIAILDFVFDEDKNEPEKFRYDVKLSDIETHKIFYEKLTFIYLEMPKFNLTENELKTKYQKWLFILKNLNKLERIPVELKESIFLKLFETAEIAKLNKDEFRQYQESLNAYRDIKNSIDTAWEEGREEGREEGEKKKQIEIARGMKMDALSIELITKYTGLSISEIEKLDD